MNDVTQSFRGPPHRYLDVGHAKLAYRCFGSGPDVVFIHGWPLSSATWRDVVATMQTRFTCHLIDLPGAGQTELLGGTDFGMASHAQTVRDAVATLGLSRYALVAHDSGGGIARYVAQAEGDRVTSLVLAGTEIPKHHSTLLKLFVALRGLPTSAWRAVMSVGFLRRSRLMLGSAFENPAHGEGEFHELMIAPLVASNDAMEGPMRFLRALDPREIDGLDRVHADISAPTLLVWGSDDKFFPPDAARKMADQFAGPTTFVEIPKGRTFVHDEQAARFAELASEHLGKTMGRATLRAS